MTAEPIEIAPRGRRSFWLVGIILGAIAITCAYGATWLIRPCLFFGGHIWMVDCGTLVVDHARNSGQATWGGGRFELFFEEPSDLGEFYWTLSDVDSNWFGSWRYIPLWPVPAIVLALVSVVCIRAILRSPRRGTCHNCGYDLRATPNRCPECGHQPQAS